MADATLELYFDFISPFAYLAWERLPELAARLGRRIEPIPVLFAALLGHYGHLGPAEIPPKRAYIFKQVLRRAAERGIVVTPPPAHPFNPLLALRIAGLPLDGGTRLRIIDAFFRATWGGGGGIADEAAVKRALAGAGVDPAPLIAAAGAPAAKATIRASTDAAIARGVFGVPTIFADGELFWGADSLEDLERFARGEDPIDPAALERWRDLPAAAERRRG
ncbi:MAG: 2-hydroxychromene-2-carboxylate isomerase [Nannocystis sp.]|nr:2-hydroxychromene-2-carboxylate isomerase [Nannocystis sp.]